MLGKPTELSDFLAKIELLDLHDRFVAEDIDMAILPLLDKGDLAELGLSLGQRKKLLNGLETLEQPDAPHTQIAALNADPRDRLVQLRRLSVMFCDMVGSTELGERLDIDEMQIILQHYYDIAHDIARRHDGHLAGSQGDGLVILFGYPRVLEGFAERCILAAQDLQTALAAAPVILDGHDPFTITTRVGIASGQAAVGQQDSDLPGDHIHLVGPVVNRAARLQSIAHPQSIAVDIKTRELTGASILYSEAEQHDLKGLPKGLEVFHVLGLHQSDEISTAPMHLIGRETQTRTLNDLWAQAQTGVSTFASISGSAGIGKTTLVQNFIAGQIIQPVRSLHFRCTAMAAQSPLRPVAHALKSLITQGCETQSLARLLNPPSPEMTQQIAQVLKLPGALKQQAAISTGDRDGILKLLSDWITNDALGPTVLVLEDAQWIDDSTRELMARTAQQAREQGAHLLMIAVTREEGAGLWPEGTGPEDMAPVTLSLPPLETDDADRLLAHIQGKAVIPETVRQNILAHADGNPLMVEALGQAQAQHQLPEMADAVVVPHTIYESVSKQLDRIQSGRHLIETLAVLRNPASSELLAEAVLSDSKTMGPALDELEQAGLISRDTDLDTNLGGEQISIRHKVYRDVIYEQIAGLSRKKLHRSAYDALCGFEQSRPEILATHAQAAQDWQNASGHALEAGDAFLKRSALVEAGHFFEMALDALARMAASTPVSQDRLRAVTGLASVERSRFGIHTEKSASLGTQAVGLARETGDKKAELLALNGLYAHALVQANYPLAETYAQSLLETAEMCQNKTFVMIATRAIGAVALHRGDQKTAVRSLTQALEQYDTDEHLPLAHVHGYDHAEICAALLSMSLWISGDLRRAREVSAFSIAHSQEIDHLHSLAQAIAFRVMLDAFARHGSQLSQAEAEAIDQAEKLGIRVMPAAAYLFPFAARLCREPSPPSDADMAELAARVERFRKVNPFNYGPLLASVLAEIYLRKGDIDAADAALSEGDRTEQATGETWTSSELLRLHARVAAARGQHALAATLRSTALEHARSTDAATIALRIACDMAEADQCAATTKTVQDALCDIIPDEQSWDVQRAQAFL